MQKIQRKSELEFIALMASLMSIVALSIDALLPALQQIGISIGITDTTDNQLLITMIFLGLGIGQLIFGPISDSLGRKPTIYIGFSLFVIASLLCVFSKSITFMILGRIIQGIGLAAPRTISIAMVRDRFSGDYMAKVMSFIVVVFILIPVIAPAIGKIILDAYGWKTIFYSQLIFGLLIMIWLWKRQPETLTIQNRKKLKSSLFIQGVKEFLKFKESILFTLISGAITGAFMVYLSASQHIFQVQYQLVDEFPYIFAGLAISVGLATFFNGIFVVKYGMQKLAVIFTCIFTLIPLIYILFFNASNNPNLWVLLLFFSLQFFAIGFLFGNLRALAMQPLGHIAGVGSAINGFVSTIIAVPIADFIGKQITTTALPLFYGFFICGLVSIVLIFLSNKKTSN